MRQEDRLRLQVLTRLRSELLSRPDVNTMPDAEFDAMLTEVRRLDALADALIACAYQSGSE